MAANQPTMELFMRFAREMLERNRRFGIGSLTERVRWETSLSYAPKICNSYRAYIGRRLYQPKICNSYRAYIGRRLVELEPALKPLIVTRKTPAADKPWKPPVKAQRVDPLTEAPIDENGPEWIL